MATYRKKPVEVTAEPVEEKREIETPEGTMVASPGDMLVTGVEGERYPVKPLIFAKTYEPVDRESAEELAPPGVAFEFKSGQIDGVYVVEDECSSELVREVAAEFVHGFIETHPDLDLTPGGYEFGGDPWDDEDDDETTEGTES